MKVVVLGGGVIGVTSAYYLAKAGHEVEVLERQAGVARETSFANAGEISPGYASPWAGPGIPRKALKWLMMKHPPLIMKPVPDLYLARWIMQMLMNCNGPSYAVNKARMVRVAEYSRDILKQLREDTGITYDERTLGTLQLFRTQKQVDDAYKDIEVLTQYGVTYEVQDREGCLATEPGLSNSRAEIAGGLRLPGDETGDCYTFTTRLADLAAQLGVSFRYGAAIEALETDDHRVTAVRSSVGTFTADAYVLALGSFSATLARQVGIDLPIYPVKGYSITIPVSDEARAPVSTVLDETYKIAITRLGDRIRVGGMAELSGYKTDLPTRRRDTLVHCVNQWFPGAGNTDGPTFWTGLRPMTPDSTPIIGRARFENLHINTGHGTLGWTMACGSARIVSDLVSGRTPDVETGDLGPGRYGR